MQSNCPYYRDKTETETNRGDSEWQQLMEDIKASKLRENLEAVDSKNAFRS